MTPDHPEPDFTGLDAERPLRPDQVARLQAALLAAATAVPAEMSATPGAGTSTEGLPLDGPRPVPPEVRDRAVGAVLAATGPAPATASTPASTTTSTTTGGAVIALSRRRPARFATLAIAAVLALLLGMAALVGRGSEERDRAAIGRSGGPTTSTVDGRPTEPEAPVADAEAAPPAPADAAAAAPGAPAASSPAPKATATAPKVAPSPATAAAPAPAAAPTTAGKPAASPAPGPPAGSAAPGSAPSAAPAPASGTSGGDPGPAPPFAHSPNGSGGSSTADSQAGVAPQPAPPPGTPERRQPPSQEAAPDDGSSERTAAPPTGAPLRIAVVGGDPAQEAAFNAYIGRVNQTGGIRNRPLEVVAANRGTPTEGAVATINLSSQPVATAAGAPGWTAGVLVESLNATEDLLQGERVFSFAGVPERLAHLAAAAVFPDQSPGATAVVYTGQGAPWERTVPAAFRESLTRRGVEVTVVAYDPDRPPSLLRPADAAFLSLDTAEAQAFLRQATLTGYRPVRGLAGIGSLYDEALLPDLPPGSTAVSPYVVPSGEEGDAIREAGGGKISARTLHGWATAKYLSVALWQSGADRPAAVADALAGLEGYDSGLAPPYQTRPGTRSRTPEGVVFQTGAGGFTAQGGFRRDPD